MIDDIEEFVAKCVADPRWLAVCLQRIGRFGGQHPVSNVLLHSLEVSHFCKPAGPRAELWGLYHDANEVLFGDLTRTARDRSIVLKGEYAAICHDIDDRLRASLGLQQLRSADRDWVIRCDRDCGDMERLNWMHVSYCCDGRNPVDYFEDRASALMAVVNATTDPVEPVQECA